MATDVILLERIEKLGNMGEVVSVKPGYARNFLLPQGKALRATNENKAYFDAQKAELEKRNEEKKKQAEKQAKNLEGLKVVIIRQAAEGGQLYGSVTARDIADIITENSKEKIERGQVHLNVNFKTIGLFPVDVALHPEVKVEVIVNIARSSDEAELQEKTGKALIAEEGETVMEAAKAKLEKAEDSKSEFLEDSAIEAEKEKAEADAAKEAERAAKAEAKAAKEAEKGDDDKDVEPTLELAEKEGEAEAAVAEAEEKAEEADKKDA